MTESARVAASVRLRTPASWVDLDLDPVTRAASIAAVVEEKAVGERVRAMLEAAAGDAATRGAVFASLFSDTVGGKAMSASLVVSVVDAEPDDVGGGAGSPGGGGQDSSYDAAALQEIRLGIAEDLAADFAEGGGESEIRALDAGPAARVRSRIAVEDGQPATTVDLVQYFVPFPGGDRLAVLSFSTPNVSLADAFAEVFDAIASTLQWSN